MLVRPWIWYPRRAFLEMARGVMIDKNGIGWIERWVKGLDFEGKCRAFNDAQTREWREGLSICLRGSPCGLTMSQERGHRKGETQCSFHNQSTSSCDNRHSIDPMRVLDIEIMYMKDISPTVEKMTGRCWCSSKSLTA